MNTIDFMYFHRILREYGYELVKRGSTTYIRRRPYTRDAPTPPMQEARNAMMLASKTGIGTRGFEPRTGLPMVAAQNRERIREARVFLKVKPARRVEVARQVADEIGLEKEEKERLIQLVK